MSQSYRKRFALTLPKRETMLAAVAAICFLLGVILPFVTFSKSTGNNDLDDIIEFLSPGFTTAQSRSVLGGIIELFSRGGVPAVVAVVIFLFSVLFPVVKLTMLSNLIVSNPSSSNHIMLLRRVETLGPWSMADVFVASVALLLLASLPGEFVVEAGYFVFLASVIAAMLATHILKRRLVS